MKRSLAALLALAVVMLAPVPVHNQTPPAYRTVTIHTSEVTQPVIGVTPDGRSLILGALGHLFEVPVAGGATTQLTFGHAYDSDPALSPDGRRVAFVSNRDGSSSNIFVLDLSTKRTTAVSHELEAVRPAWSPDGRTIAYFRNVPHEDHPLDLVPSFGDSGLREIRTVPSGGGQATVVGTPQLYEAVFYLPDGRLAWTVREPSPNGGMFGGTKQTRIEARGQGAAPTLLVAAPGDLGRVVVGPKGNGVYYTARGAVEWLPFTPSATPTVGPRVQENGARLALNRDGSVVYFGASGGLWRAALPSGEPTRIPFTSTMALETRTQVIPKYEVPSTVAGPAHLRPVLAPDMTPDGTQVAFMAGGLLWEQPLSGGPATQLFHTRGFLRDPAFSPDGTKLAYVSSEFGTRTLRVYDFATKQTKTLFTVGGASWPLYPSWSPDGQRIVFQHSGSLGAPFPIVIVTVSDGQTKEIARTVGSWTARPEFSRDGRSVYFTNRPDKIAQFYRVALESGTAPEPVTALTRHVNEGLVSPDGKWFAFRRNSEIWIAPMGRAPITDARITRFSPVGGRSFSFASDSGSIVFSDAGHMFRQAVAGGPRAEIHVDVTMNHKEPAPLLVSRVRVLDYVSRRFSDETSMFIENGRIRWIGAEQGHELPADTVKVDAAGRYAIPGLWDMHVHSAWANNQTSEDAFIAYGVTSVRDTGGTLDVLTALDDRSRIMALPAPRYFYSGEIFEGLMPLWGDAFLQIGTEQEARAEVRDFKAAGASFIKMYPSLPWYLQQAVADEAHLVGLPVVGHGLSLEELTRRVDMGFTSIEHGNMLTSGHDDMLKMLAATKTPVDPTLSVFGGALMRASEPDWEANWRVQTFVPAESRQGGGGRGGRGGRPQTVDQLRAAAKGTFDGLQAAGTDHVALLGGTDSMMGGVYFGQSLHFEIAQFADAGVAPIDVLRMATQGAADVVGAGRDLGSLTVGKLGDVVLLDKDPLQNIRNTQAIWQVIKSGRVFDPAKLRPAPATRAARAE